MRSICYGRHIKIRNPYKYERFISCAYNRKVGCGTNPNEKLQIAKKESKRTTIKCLNRMSQYIMFATWIYVIKVWRLKDLDDMNKYNSPRYFAGWHISSYRKNERSVMKLQLRIRRTFTSRHKHMQLLCFYSLEKLLLRN